MTTQFFIPMRPPTTTHNAKELHAYMKGGKPCAVLYDSAELKAARAKPWTRKSCFVTTSMLKSWQSFSVWKNRTITRF